MIPSGMYPRSLHEDERKILLLDIFSDFKSYLESYNINTQVINQKEEIIYKISVRGKVKHRFCFFDTISNISSLDKNSTLVIFKLEEKVKQKLIAEHISWIDLNSMIKFCTNDYTEELIAFLKHYGLRFKGAN